MIETENADATIGKLTGDSHHVVAAVAAGQTVHQNDERAARPPARWAVVVQDENVAVRKFDDVLSRGVSSLLTRQVVAQ